MEQQLKTTLTTPADFDVLSLLETLSDHLESRFGSSGKNSFQEWDENNPKFIFVKVRNANETVGCGAVRPITNEIGEVKRMFAKYTRQGIGETVLGSLENQAKEVGYSELYLETRVKNTEACNFYLKNGYQRIENYGRYLNNPEAACFGKKLKQVFDFPLQHPDI